MLIINITNVRKDFYKLVESASLYHEPVLITGKVANAVLIAEDDWNTIQKTLGLVQI